MRVSIATALSVMLLVAPTSGQAQVSDRERMREIRNQVLTGCNLEGSQFTIEERVNGPAARFSPSLTDDQQRCITATLSARTTTGLPQVAQKHSTGVMPQP